MTSHWCPPAIHYVVTEQYLPAKEPEIKWNKQYLKNFLM